jgi:hypothetical protein
MINAQKPLPAESLFGRVSPTPFFVDDSNNKGLIGSGNRDEPLTFLPGEETEFTIPFQVQFSPNKEVSFLFIKYGLVDDPTMNELIQLCLGGDPTRKSTIYYEAKTEIKALSWSPFQPTLTGQLNISCPFQGDALTKFIASVKGEASGSTAPSQLKNGSSLLTGSNLIADGAKATGNLGSKEILVYKFNQI